MSTPENPPAFPVAMIPEWQEGSPGMSLRDWFAGQVIGQTMQNALNHDGTWDPDNVAYHAYLVADAMLTARRVAEPESAPAPVQPTPPGICRICNLPDSPSGQKWKLGECDCCPF